MTPRVKTIVSLVIAGAIASLILVPGRPAQQWGRFFVYLAAILVSSGMKISLPRSKGTMTVNFPFIFLGILQLSPLQAVSLAVCSVIAQCRIRVMEGFSAVQVLFNISNVITSTVLAWLAYTKSLPWLHHELAPALAVAATVYFFVNTIPVAVVIAWDSLTLPFPLWRRDFVWYLPFYVVGAMLAAAANLIELAFGWMTAILLIPAVYTFYRAYQAQTAMVRDRERHLLEMEALQLRTIEALAMAIEAKDENTHRHLIRVRTYVSELGRIVGLDESGMKALHVAAFLHDIGKLAIPEHILNKPGKLTREEFEKIKIHTVVGADILERVKFPYPVVPIVRAHHEAWDGSGYPDGLRGEEIPVGARILTAVDCFDALASDRPYRRALPLQEAMAIVKSKSGSQFDPTVVALLEQHYERLEAVARDCIEDVDPLQTDLRIPRGAAPGAGFAAEEPASTELGSGSLSTEPHVRCSELVAAASQEDNTIAEINRMLGGSLSAVHICAATSSRLQRMIPFECFAVYVISGSSAVPLYIDGHCSSAFSSKPFPPGEGVSGWVAQSGQPIVNGNPAVEPNYVQSSNGFADASSALSVPLLDLSGAAFGALTVYARGQKAFSRDHLRILEAIQAKFSLALQNTLLSRTAGTDARVDPLTRLWNIRYFFERLNAEIENSRLSGRSFGLVISDLNGFKAVNDLHGHVTGNALLRAIAGEFQDSCRPVDTVARRGDDGFAFLIPSLQAPAAAARLAALEEAVQRSCARLEIEVSVSSSMGVAFYPADGETAEALLGAADRGMYESKRNFYQLHSDAEVQAGEELSTV